MSQDPSSSFLDSPPSSNAQSHKFLLDESFDGLGDDSADAFSLPQRDRDQASKSSAHPEKKNAGKKRMSMATSDLRRDVQGQQRESRATGGDSRIGNLAAKLSKAKIDNPPPSSSSSFNSNEPSGSSSQSQLDDNFEDDDQMRRGNRRHTDDDSQQAVDGEEGERGDMPSDRSEALLQERDQLAMMNTILEACVDGLRGASEKVQRFENTLSTTHSLLDLYTRFLSQSEHIQHLILEQNWQGVAEDKRYLDELEELETRRRLEAEEKEREKKLDEERKAREEEERRERERAEREAAAAAPATRGRGRGRTSSTRSRGASSSTSSIARGRGISNIPTAGGSGIGRGAASVTGVRGQRGLRSRVGVTPARGRGS